jgi:REP element-mobilizing transposase RayT
MRRRRFVGIARYRPKVCRPNGPEEPSLGQSDSVAPGQGVEETAGRRSAGDLDITHALVPADRANWFGTIADGEMALNSIGRIIAERWQWLGTRYSHSQLGPSVIMPNHLHGLITVRSAAQNPVRVWCANNAAGGCRLGERGRGRLRLGTNGGDRLEEREPCPNTANPARRAPSAA